MYASPLTERIRKRKAFADSELDSTTRLLPMLHSTHPLTSNGAPVVMPSPTSPNQMYSMPLSPYLMKDTLYNSNNVGYGTAKGHAPANAHHAFEFSNYLRSRVLHTYENNNNNVEFGGGNSETHKLRLVDESQLMGYYPTAAMSTEECDMSPERCSNVAKPRLSFSIESIIGIK